MHISYFDQGRRGFVAHGARIPNSECTWSIWFDQDGYPRDAERRDRCGRVYDATPTQWQLISGIKLAGLETAKLIQKSALRG